MWCAFGLDFFIMLSCLFLRGSNFFIFLLLYDRSLAVLIVKINIFNILEYSVFSVVLMGHSAGIFFEISF